MNLRSLDQQVNPGGDLSEESLSVGVTALNAATAKEDYVIQPGELLFFLAKHKLIQVLESSSEPDAVSMLELLRNPHSRGLDIRRPGQRKILINLVEKGLITDEQRLQLIKIGRRSLSPAKLVGLGKVTVAQLRKIRMA